MSALFNCNPKEQVTHVDANIQGLGNPVRWNTRGEPGRKAIDISGGRATVVVDIAGKARLVDWVADHKDTLHRIERGSSQFGESVGRSCGTLRVSFENEALVGVRGQSGLNLPHDLETVSVPMRALVRE